MDLLLLPVLCFLLSDAYDWLTLIRCPQLKVALSSKSRKIYMQTYPVSLTYHYNNDIVSHSASGILLYSL